MRLQYKTSGDFTASDCCDELFQFRNLSDVRAFINETSHMNGKSAAVHIVRFLAEQIEQLCIAHGDEKVKAVVGVGHDEKEHCLSVSKCVKLKFVICCHFTEFCNIEHCQSCSTAH